MSEKKTEKSEIARREEEILEYWNKNNIFKKSVDKKAPKGEFVFYDGPPFATGLPHYGHVLPSTMKDVIPRYKTMQGYKVERLWGWDCHGLPIEELIEREHGFKNKKDIEEYGIDKFNEEAEASVLRYEKEWKDIIPRIGRWADMDNAYKTMGWRYTESIWWAFKNLYDQGLIYEGHKSMHLCPRCGTTLSNFEVTQGYKDIKDISVTAKFELADEKGVYILAWTTTPWTLPGNAALAVDPDIDYVKIKKDDEYYILAKERLSEVVEGEYEVVDESKGLELVGKSYIPLFDYYSGSEDLENKQNGWKVYHADFVNTEDGTGIVHIAPAFGEDDMSLGQKMELPFIQHVGMDGVFAKEVRDFADMPVKPKDDHQSTDIEIIKYLAKKRLLFSKKKIEHPYPHCWRCDTPLLNYAAMSWFVRVTSLVKRLISNNKKTEWIPEHMKEGRFGKWLKGARDWAISRSRYWGAPLPVWRCEECEKEKVVGSIDELTKEIPESGNKFLVMRHGQAESNATDIVSSKVENKHHVTEQGKEEIKDSIQKLKSKNINIVFASPFLRTKETAEIVAKELGIKDVVIDERIKEIDTGIFNMKSSSEYHAHFSSTLEKFTKRPPEGENLTDVKKRVMDFFYDINTKYKDKNILVISHEYSIWMMMAGSNGLDKKESAYIKEDKPDFVHTGEVIDIELTKVPHDEQYELDLHRPYIDEIIIPCECGKDMKRIPEVFDCWFESGSMPYASLHYPFENKSRFSKRFPADFIAEGVDQTRGWFYNLLVLSTGLFDKPAFKNVVVNGLVMAEDGKKMSKRLKNYPELDLVLDKYGADALRLFLMMSPAVHAEEVNFSEKAVKEVLNKAINRLWNVVTFYEMYKDLPAQAGDNPESSSEGFSSDNVLDRWIIVRLEETIKEIEMGLDNYEFDKASRPILGFVDDLSTWYLRRSRERFKANPAKRDARSDGFRRENEMDKKQALATTRFVLLEFSKAIAPFTPFIAESIYQKVAGRGKKESVHLECWPAFAKASADKPSTLRWITSIFGSRKKDPVLEEMKKVRGIVTLGLEARQKAGIKVRQPLNELRINLSAQAGNYELRDEYKELIKDEVNVKEVVFNESIENEIELDTSITKELKKEGDFRELLRGIQDTRKKEGLDPHDEITLIADTQKEGKDLIKEFENEIKSAAQIKSIDFGTVSDGYEIKVGDLIFKIKIKK